MAKKKSSIALITDSTASIPPDMCKQYNIFVVPQHIIWGTQDMLDGIEITTEQFYARLTKDPVHPKTSQPNASQFAEAIKQAKKAGAKSAVIITLSDKLSKTYDSAQQAGGMVDIPIRVYDSKSAGMGLGWQVVAAARARESGADAEAMVAAADKARRGMAVMLTVDTLEYLHKGGRIGNATKLIGTALNLKPQLYLNHDTGIIEPGDRTRTRKKAVDSVYRAFFAAMKGKSLHLTVHQAAALEEAEALAARIRAEHKPAELFVFDLPPVVGVHVGPGTLGIAGYYEL